MQRILFLFVYLCVTCAVFAQEESFDDLFPSAPEQIGSLRCEPDYLIGGLVSPLSGQPVLRRTDLLIKGAQNIVLSRVYIPPYMPFYFPQFKHDLGEHHKEHLYHQLKDNYKGWKNFLHLRLELFSGHRVRLCEPSGMTLDFQLTAEGSELASPAYAINNVSGDSPSGKCDPRNTRIIREPGGVITVYAPDGTIRSYLTRRNRESYQLFLLHKEILPHGKILKYHYNGDDQLIRLESQDPQERYVYAALQSEGSTGAGHSHFTSSTGQQVDYHYDVKHISGEYTHKHKHRKLYKKFNYTLPSLLTSVSSPFYRHESLAYTDRFLLSAYFGKEVFKPDYAAFGEGAMHYRVHKLLLPVAASDAFESVYEMHYTVPVAGKHPGATRVKNSDGSSIEYHFSPELLTTAIDYFAKDGQLRKQKIYTWDENHYLASLEIQDAHKNLLYKKSYSYDRFGNPIIETLTGDLTGQGQLETFTIKRIFSQDGRHLLLQEESEEGKVVRFSYLAQTNCLTSKLIKDQNRILLREFYLYDDSNNLIKKIVDDGNSENGEDVTGVTQRTITTYVLRQSPPFLHMPEWIEETYWQENGEKPLKKTHLLYDQQGNAVQEEVYDAAGVLRYTICKTYNERGDVLTETNRQEQKALYTYDSKGNLETQTSYSDRWIRTFCHDLRNRLLSCRQAGDDGIIHKNLYAYDFQDRLISKTDPFDNCTRYAYDPLVNKIAQTDFPPISNLQGQAVPVTTSYSYDAMGNPLCKIDANGHITTYQYNAYGSPTQITHPSGAVELFRYAANGERISYTDPDGLITDYTMDVLGRVLSKTYSARGVVFAQESYTYNGFNLLSETDKQGHIKHYTYDGAGRKIREEFGNHITAYNYDPLGYLTTLCKYNSDNSLLIHYQRDLDGRILEESKTDILGNLLHKIQYAYDANGNRSSITRYIDGKNTPQTCLYDSLDRLIEEKDALGHISRTFYEENLINSLGQRVLQIQKVDPQEITHIDTQDAFSRSIRHAVIDPQGATAASLEKTYDPEGNLLYQSDHVIEDGQSRKTQILKYAYTPNNHIESLTRAFGTDNAKTTRYAYSLSGKMLEKTLPDGVTLRFSYHPLGSLTQIDSSDGQIHLVFAYDHLDHLVYAEDLNHHIAIHREVDSHGNVLSERFNKCFEVNKNYDAFNRVLSLQMADEGKVHYHYDPLFLRRVERVSPQGKKLYTHQFLEYDPDGNLLSEEMLGDLGCIRHAIDPRGQQAALFTPYFSQQFHYDPVGNLRTSITDGISQHYAYDALSQLCSEESNSYAYDSLYNRVASNGHVSKLNDLNELLSSHKTHCAYDPNGNQVLKRTPDEAIRYTYDPLNRLIEASSDKIKVQFSYDPLGRRLSKTIHTLTIHGWKETCENYLYHGSHEIGAFTSSSKPKNIRVLSLTDNFPKTLALELEGHLFAPITDIQGNIRRLIDPQTKQICSSYNYTAFGKPLETTPEHVFNPWRFASKRFDPELGLIYYGKRYYDPLLARWLTIDPAGFIDSVNLYQYVFNNPFRYTDPDGRFALMLPILALTWKVVAVAVATAIISYEIEHQQHKRPQSGFAREFNAAMHEFVQHSGGLTQYLLNQQLDELEAEKKKKNVYAPDRKLPLSEDGIPIPDTDAPHTQIGIKESKKNPGEKYPKAREFDGNGKPVRDIDFTDHGMPNTHTNPHQHRHAPNKTGGTPERQSAEPLSEWKY